MSAFAARSLAVALAVAFAPVARAQTPPPPPDIPATPTPPAQPAPSTLPAPPAATAPGAAPDPAAAAPPPARPWTITPFITLAATYSDNVAAVPAPAARSGWITDITPGLRIEADASRVRGFLEYRLHDLRYSTDSSLDARQNYLQSRFTVDAVRNFAAVDLRADIAQESRSPFEAAPPGETPTASANRVETTTLEVSPWVRGAFGDVARYEARLRAGEVSTDDGTIPDTRTTEWAGRIGSASASARLGWSVEASTLEARNDEIGALDDTRFRARLLWSVLPTLRLVAGTGVDRTDFAGPPTRREDTPGAGFFWIPSPRTSVAALYERRVFGDGYGASVSWRTARTAWRLASTKDAAVLPGLTAAGTRTNLATLAADLLAASNPDPEVREAQARAQLANAGISGAPILGSSLLSSRPVVYRQTELTSLYTGVKDTLSFRYAFLEQQEYGEALDGSPASGGAQHLRRWGVDLNWSHRFTPMLTGTVALARLVTDGLSDGAPDTRQQFATASFATALGQRTVASAGVRFTRFDSSAPDASYDEKAVFVQVTMRF